MSQLTTNTTSLQAILDAVNKLPEAGGEDVTAETETYTDLLTDLEAAVDALPDAGSGGAVETCTVTIKASGDAEAIMSYACTKVNNGTIEGELTFYIDGSHSEIVLSDILCGSTFVVVATGMPMEFSVSGGIEQLGILVGNTRAYRAPTTDGASGTVEIG